jgi:hypothetical protein
VGGGPPETGGRRREVSEGDVDQQKEGEKRIHRRILLALFISFNGGLWLSPARPEEDQKSKEIKKKRKINERVASV